MRRLNLIVSGVVAACGLVVPVAGQPAYAWATSSSASEVQRPPASPLSASASDVLAMTSAGNDGVDVLVARGDDAAFTRLTTLTVAGWSSEGWVASSCVTGDAKYLAVTFAPRAFINRQELRDGRAFGAVVNLATGGTWVVPERVSMHYYNPGCGVGSLISWTRQESAESSAAVNLVTADADQGRVLSVTRVKADLSSVVPLSTGELLASNGKTLVSVSTKNGAVRALADADGPVFDIRPNDEGGGDFLVATSPQRTTAWRLSQGRSSLLGSGTAGATRLVSGRAGKNHLLIASQGDASAIDVVRSTLAVSSLDGSFTAQPSQDQAVVARDGIREKRLVAVEQRSPQLANQQPPSTTGPYRSNATLQAAPTSTSPCAIAPLDPGAQVIQPSPAQVEWAAHKAVRGELTATRPANWQKHGLPAYEPQSVFPMPTLTTGASGRVPVQLLMGLLAQESNFHQASSVALPGVATDPLIGDFYGVVYDSQGFIVRADSTKSDCGYGLGQITTNMTKSASAWSADKKRQVATDYQVNVAASVSFLMNNWNLLAANNMLMNDGDPAKLENWYAALWIYNSGFHPFSALSPWGLGWTNNPAQNDYLPNRHAFLETSYQDASTPYMWPYQELVLGWAEHPQQDFQTQGFKYAGTGAKIKIAPRSTFCSTTINNCDPDNLNAGYCLFTDRTQCWWGAPATWLLTGNGTTEVYKSNLAATEPAVANPYPASCTAAASSVRQLPGTTALPTNAVIVDDQSSGTTNVTGCADTYSSAGTFALTYGTDSSGNPTAAIDTHQLGVGFMGHSYFARSVDASRSHVLVTGTWTPPSTAIGWQRVWVHLANNGADTHQAQYLINTGTKTYTRTVNQRWNKNTWFDLGSFLFTAGAKVQLKNSTFDDFNVASYGNVDVSFDAVAFSPSAKPAVAYVALGDSYQSGEGLSPYYENSDVGGGKARTDACHRSSGAYGPGVFTDLGALSTGTKHFQFSACSGAVIDNLLTTSRFAEAPQLSQGWLDENTTHVSVGIGGNDARFSTIIQACATSFTSCTSSNYRLGNDPEPLVTYEPKVIDRLSERLQALYAAIRTAAPNAKVLVVGYPRVIALANRRSDAVCSLLLQEHIQFFSDMGLRLNAIIKTRATAAGFKYVDPVSTFAGPPSHEACTSDASLEWINGTIARADTGSSGLLGDIPGPGSFHPNVNGHGTIRRLVHLAWL